MNILKKILHKFNGMHYTREYICFPQGSHTYPIQVLLKHKNATKDLTDLLLMVGINPLIIVLPSIKEIDLANTENLQIDYVQPLQNGNFISLATLQLKELEVKNIEGAKAFFFEAIKGNHKFIPQMNQSINKFYNNLFNKKNNNIFLDNNLYKLIQIAYASPKRISLVTVSDGIGFNLFPTDQHGQINNDHYIVTLRSAGKACEQVKRTKKIAISNVKATYFKQVYIFGKNHMLPLRDKTSIDFSNVETQVLKLPLPHNTTEYKELELNSFFQHGIHTIYLFRILNENTIADKAATLVCINNAYATWRFKHGLPCNYFLD